MNEGCDNINSEIPLIGKMINFYKKLYSCRQTVSRLDRYTIWQKSENITLEVMENILTASQMNKSTKLPYLENASVKINLLKIVIRLVKEVKAIDDKKYISLQQSLDEIGRMLGGWVKSMKNY